MREHGLPVLVPRDEWRLRKRPEAEPGECDPLVIRLADLDAARTDRWLAARRRPRPALPRTTADFLRGLETASVPL